MQEYKVEYQFENRDCRDFDDVRVHASNEDEAIEFAKQGKGFGSWGNIKIPPKHAFKFKVIND